MVSFINLPTLRFPKQNRLTLDGLEALGRARQRKGAIEHRNRLLAEAKRRRDEAIAFRKKQADRVHTRARRRA